MLRDVLDVASGEACEPYGADLVPIRSDHHIAWRGNAAPAAPLALIGQITGFGKPA